MEMDSPVLDCKGITAAERERAIQFRAEARTGLAQAIHGLSEKQWSFKPSVDCWSVTETVEHLAIVNSRLLSILGNLEQGRAVEQGHDREAATRVVAATISRLQKFQAPSHISPTGLLPLDAAFQQFLKMDSLINDALDSSPHLRGRTLAHPVLGALEGYEWILVGAAHNVRHTNQILEVKANPQFPSN